MKDNEKPKPLATFVFDEVTVFTLKAEVNPQAVIKAPPVGLNAPILTLEVDEMTEFVLKALPVNGDAPPGTGDDIRKPVSGQG